MGFDASTPLKRYVELDEAFYALYEAYTPDEETLAAVRDALPQAHVLVLSRYTCSDCARNVPAMARIAEHLPDWTWQVLPSDDTENRAAYNIQRTPTFILYRGDEEIGRIVENPVTGTLETDLLWLVTQGE